MESKGGGVISASKPKRVVHFSSVHTPYDTRIFLKECTTLAASGYDVTFVVQGPADAERNGVKFVTVPKAASRKDRMFKTARAVYREALNLNADIYHFHDPELVPYGIRLKLKGKKVVYDVHEEVANDVKEKSWIPKYLRWPLSIAMTLMQKFGVMFFDGVIASRPSLLNDFPKRKTVLVSNYPILGELEKSGPIKPFRDRPRRAAYVGGMGYGRGILELVAGLGALPEDYDFELWLAGELNPKSCLDVIKDMPGFRRLKLLGMQSRPQVADLLDNARFGVVFFKPLPNHVRSFPTKLFEYASASLPTMATDMPHWVEIVEKGGLGLVVDIDDPKAVADKIMWMTDHPDECQAMGQACREAVQNEYNWGVEAKSLLGLYERILA